MGANIVLFYEMGTIFSPFSSYRKIKNAQSTFVAHASIKNRKTRGTELFISANRISPNQKLCYKTYKSTDNYLPLSKKPVYLHRS